MAKCSSDAVLKFEADSFLEFYWYKLQDLCLIIYKDKPREFEYDISTVPGEIFQGYVKDSNSAAIPH